MCGIIGVICQDNDALRSAHLALHQLQNRGYDSVGILSINSESNVTIEKHITDDEMALQKLAVPVGSKIALGHTRWATHGPKTVNNAHPHLDSSSTIAVIHNGIIENFQQLKNELLREGVHFASETDSEVIANVIFKNFTKLNGDMIAAIEQTTLELEGTWGLVVVCLKDPHNLYCTRKGSPLLVGKSERAAYVTSEQSGFCGKVVSYIALDDGEMCILSMDEEKVMIRTVSKSFDLYDQLHMSIQPNALQLVGYSHWMEKEIFEQEESCFRALGLGGRISSDRVCLGGLANCNRLANIDNLVLLSCGTSRHAAMFSRFFFLSLCCFTSVQSIDASDFSSSELPKRGKTVAILISQSGETRDLQKIIPSLRNLDIPMIGVVNVVGSQIARDVDCGVYCNAGREVSVASTKSFTSQVVCLVLISAWFSQKQDHCASERKRVIASLRELPRDIGKVLKLWDSVEKAALLLKDSPNCFVLGRGIQFPIALEGALKIKEIARIHAEGVPCSSLKHGPFGLLSEEFPIILSNVNDDPLVEICRQEIMARHSPTILISHRFPAEIVVPKNECFAPLLVAVVYQMLAYRLSVLRQLDPDFPKNLAKVVTTD